MEITNEVKANIFSQYLGKYIIHNGKKYRIKGVFEDFKRQWFIIGYHEEDFETHIPLGECKLESRPISAISDEDAIEVAKILKPNDEHTHRPDYGKMYIKQLFDGVMYSVDKSIKLYQYLISKGYDLPNYHLGGKTLQECGLAIYE